MDKINDYNIGYIKNVPNQNNSSSLIDIYVAGNTINGYCYKDYDTFYPFDYTIQNTQIDDISPTIIEDGNNKKLVLPNILNFNYNISTDKEDDYEL